MLDEMNDIGSAKGRLADLDDIYRRLMHIVEERGVAYGDDPFGSTGLYERKFRIGGSREYPMIVEEYSMDRRLLREIQSVRMAARKERSAPKKEGAPHQSLAEYQAILDAGMARVAKAKAEAAAKDATQADESPEK